MSKYKEFFLQADKKDIQTFEYTASEQPCYPDDIHVVEYRAIAELVEENKRLRGQCIQMKPDMWDEKDLWIDIFLDAQKYREGHLQESDRND